MTLRSRMWVMGALIAAALAAYGTAKFYSPSLMIYVTAQALIQKAPSGISPETINQRYHTYLSSLPDSESRLEAVMAISQYLEKIQQISPQELDRLLKIN